MLCKLEEHKSITNTELHNIFGYSASHGLSVDNQKLINSRLTIEQKETLIDLYEAEEFVYNCTDIFFDVIFAIYILIIIFNIASIKFNISLPSIFKLSEDGIQTLNTIVSFFMLVIGICMRGRYIRIHKLIKSLEKSLRANNKESDNKCTTAININTNDINSSNNIHIDAIKDDSIPNDNITEKNDTNHKKENSEISKENQGLTDEQADEQTETTD